MKTASGPSDIERTVNVLNTNDLDALRDAGATHIIMSVGEPWDMDSVEALVEWRDRKNIANG